MSNAEVIVEAIFGDAEVKMAVDASKVREVVEGWGRRLQNIPTDDVRRDTRQLIVESLMEERHNDREEAILITSAVLWLAATEPKYGDSLLDLMAEGAAEIAYEITRLGPTGFNFRLRTDNATLKKLSGK